MFQRTSKKYQMIYYLGKPRNPTKDDSDKGKRKKLQC